ncbi:MAG: hypothetical protein AAF490_18560 [Chloroflexota bacterium]
MQNIELGPLKNGPHADLIQNIADKCTEHKNIQAIWVGGSLAAGHGDIYSDIDFRIAVEPGAVDQWDAPDWDKYLPILPCGGALKKFGEEAVLHHLILDDGTILDFFVQDTTRQNFEPAIVILGCRDEAFGEKLAQFSRPSTSLIKEINNVEARQFLIDYWITTHKEMKGLARKYDLSPFVGLYYERLALLRAWHMQAVGKDITARATLHMLDKLHRGLEGYLTDDRKALMGLPSRTPEETAVAIEAIREEMSQVGRCLAKKYEFEYPHEIEKIVRKVWSVQKEVIIKR